MSKQKQHNQGPLSLILGLLLVTAAVVGILFFSNRNDKDEVFRETGRQPLPEVLINGEAPRSDKPLLPERLPPETPREEPVVVNSELVIVSSEEVAEQEKTSSTVVTQTPLEPTPEQILNEGSIEKARASMGKTDQQPSVKQSESHRQQLSAVKNNDVVLQMGSFSSRERAETQRAKLAMIGVVATVNKEKVGDRFVYRVQSRRMNHDAAQRIRQILERNGISSFAYTAR